MDFVDLDTKDSDNQGRMNLRRVERKEFLGPKYLKLTEEFNELEQKEQKKQYPDYITQLTQLFTESHQNYCSELGKNLEEIYAMAKTIQTIPSESLSCESIKVLLTKLLTIMPWLICPVELGGEIRSTYYDEVMYLNTAYINEMRNFLNNHYMFTEYDQQSLERILSEAKEQLQELKKNEDKILERYSQIFTIVKGLYFKTEGVNIEKQVSQEFIIPMLMEEFQQTANDTIRPAIEALEVMDEEQKGQKEQQKKEIVKLFNQTFLDYQGKCTISFFLWEEDINKAEVLLKKMQSQSGGEKDETEEAIRQLINKKRYLATDFEKMFYRQMWYNMNEVTLKYLKENHSEIFWNEGHRNFKDNSLRSYYNRKYTQFQEQCSTILQQLTPQNEQKQPELQKQEKEGMGLNQENNQQVQSVESQKQEQIITTNRNQKNNQQAQAAELQKQEKANLEQTIQAEELKLQGLIEELSKLKTQYRLNQLKGCLVRDDLNNESRTNKRIKYRKTNELRNEINNLQEKLQKPKLTWEREQQSKIQWSDRENEELKNIESQIATIKQNFSQENNKLPPQIHRNCLNRNQIAWEGLEQQIKNAYNDKYQYEIKGESNQEKQAFLGRIMGDRITKINTKLQQPSSQNKNNKKTRKSQVGIGNS